MNNITLARASSALSAALAVALLVAPVAAAPTSLAAGSTITATLQSADLNSKNAYVGQRFSMHLAPPYPNGDASYANAIIYGHVTNVRKAGQGRPAQLNLAFDRIVLANGMSAAVYGHILKADMHQEDTTLQKAAGAGVGMVVGNYIGKHLGTNLGGLIGAGGGFLYANNLKANIYLKTGASVTLQLDHTLIPGRRQSSH